MNHQVALRARDWIGTPFVHQGRVKGVGVDCIGLLIGAAQEAGLGLYSFTAYGRHPDPAVMLREVAQNLIRVHRPPAPGDVLLFRIVGEPTHLGIYLGEQRFVHAYLVRGKVVEDILDAPWKRRLIGVYELKDHYEH